jgi:hypothetical protein
MTDAWNTPEEHSARPEPLLFLSRSDLIVTGMLALFGAGACLKNYKNIILILSDS